MSEMTPQAVAQLREPFPNDRVGLLPKPYRRDSQKGNCDVCGKWHGLPALHLDYVGHGAVTERLLEVDPEWTWEPVSFDEKGQPAVTSRDGTATLWIRLTVLGVTRYGVGTASASKPEVVKELIGDAIRNAAMRFGVALDLWIKGDKAEGSETDTRVAGVEDDVSKLDRVVNQYKADLFSLADQNRELAAQLWDQAMTDHGFGSDPIGSESDALDVYQSAVAGLREMRAMKVERFEPASPDEMTAPFELEGS